MASPKTQGYDFIAALGSGMFGEVAKFRRQSDQAIVAVKRVSRENIKSAIREARLLATLTDRNAYEHHIVRFHKCFQDQSYIYIVEEALDQSLADFQIRNKLWKLEIRDIRTIALQVLIALAKLKDLGIVHTDIKQDNIMLVNQRCHPFRLKVIDFGQSLTDKELASLRTPHIQPRPLRAPEVILGYPCSGKVDMWSLGCLLGQMALGQKLFPCDCEMDLAHKIFGTRGLPSTSMLDSAIKTSKFFDRIDIGSEAHNWQLKPYKVPEGSRRTAAANLQELERSSKVVESTELVDRRCLADLINQMLILEPEQRISPDQALCHPFLTMEHLKQRAIHQPYYSLSLQGYREAGVSLPQDSSSMPDDSSEENVPGVSKQEKQHSQRRSLHSQRKKQPAAAQGSEDPLEGSSRAGQWVKTAGTCWAARKNVRKKQGCKDAATQFNSLCNISSSAYDTGESLISSDSSSEPPKKGFLRGWLRTVFSCFAGCRGGKSVGTQCNNTTRLRHVDCRERDETETQSFVAAKEMV